jgi:RNA polymerase sigma factor (sigma-70 family)
LYRKVFPKVRSYICKNSGNKDDAFDIFQDAVVCLCRIIKEGRYNEKYEPAAFLYSVSRNLWVNKIKKESRSVPMPDNMDITDHYDFSNDIITAPKAKTIREVIKKLGEKCYQLLQYAIYQNKPNPEICEIMGFASVNAVKTQKYKCKQKLTAMLKEDPGLREIFE